MGPRGTWTLSPCSRSCATWRASRTSSRWRCDTTATRAAPRARPGEFSAAGLLERGETDAALVVGFDALRHLPPRAADNLRGIPTIVVDPRATDTAAAARVAFATAASGVHREGTVHRMDGVPLTLHAPLGSERAGDEEVLAAIGARIVGEEGT